MNDCPMNVQVHAFLPESSVNGPGLRSVLWVQGCFMACPGCFNPETHSMSGGESWSVEEILSRIPNTVEGISISGGEPFLQVAACYSLARACHGRGLTVLVYTGYRWEFLAQGTSEDAKALLGECDYLIDGRFEASSRSNHPWVGSGNQRVLQMKPTVRILNEAPEPLNEALGELHITPSGDIIITGFFE